MDYKKPVVIITLLTGVGKATLKEPARLATPQATVSSYEKRSEAPEPAEEQQYAALGRNNGYMYNINKPITWGWQKTEVQFASWLDS